MFISGIVLHYAGTFKLAWVRNSYSRYDTHCRL